MRRSTKRRTSSGTVPKSEHHKIANIFHLQKLLLEQDEKYIGSKYDLTRYTNGDGNKSWAGAKSFEQATNIMNGYVNENLNEIAFKSYDTGNRFELCPEVSGEFNDPAAYICGVPECMAEFKYQETNNFINIFIDINCACDVKADFINKQLNILFSIIQGLEINKTRCKISVGIASCDDYNNNKNNYFTVGVKEYQDPINPSLHGYILGHVSFFRVFLFSYMSKLIKKPSLGKIIKHDLNEGIRIDLLNDTKEIMINKLK